MPDLDKCKYLVPRDLSVGKFLYVVRKRIKLAPEHGMEPRPSIFHHNFPNVVLPLSFSSSPLLLSSLAFLDSLAYSVSLFPSLFSLHFFFFFFLFFFFFFSFYLILFLFLFYLFFLALYLYVNGTLPATSDLMSKVYEDHKKGDGFLYMTYNGESTFGAPVTEDDEVLAL